MPNGYPPITRTTVSTCRAHYPGGSNECMCRLLPHPRGLPRFAGGSASAPLLSRPAQTSLTLRPVRLLNRPRRPLSRGFDPADCPTKPLVSYQSNRQLSAWNLPPLVIRAIGAHCETQDICSGRSPLTTQRRPLVSQRNSLRNKVWRYSNSRHALKGAANERRTGSATPGGHPGSRCCRFSLSVRFFTNRTVTPS